MGRDKNKVTGASRERDTYSQVVLPDYIPMVFVIICQDALWIQKFENIKTDEIVWDEDKGCCQKVQNLNSIFRHVLPATLGSHQIGSAVTPWGPATRPKTHSRNLWSIPLVEPVMNK